jgi:uncharacterized protein (DUF1919 family)
MIYLIKRLVKRGFIVIAKRLFHFECSPFPSIISNDCFGGEIYRALRLQYNTPFIGLMLMAPCYIKLLRDINFYLGQDLTFIKTSRYPHVNELLKARGYFPIATINNEIEIQFLHYKSQNEALNKWNARRKRVNFDNLFVKYDFSKDYGLHSHLDEFLRLSYSAKLAIGCNECILKYGKDFINLPEYSADGAVLFRLSLRYLDYKKLLVDGVIAQPSTFKGKFLRRFLINARV